MWFNVGLFIFQKNYKEISTYRKFEYFLSNMAKKNLMKAYKHKGKHITVNTVSELEEAKNQINKFI